MQAGIHKICATGGRFHAQTVVRDDAIGVGWRTPVHCKVARISLRANNCGSGDSRRCIPRGHNRGEGAGITARHGAGGNAYQVIGERVQVVNEEIVVISSDKSVAVRNLGEG